MIKAGTQTKDGRRMVILGLSEGNWGSLREGKPIMVDLAPFGVDAVVTIMGGETEASITHELAQVFKLPS
jgi:hypothetical protein